MIGHKGRAVEGKDGESVRLVIPGHTPDPIAFKHLIRPLLSSGRVLLIGGCALVFGLLMPSEVWLEIALQSEPAFTTRPFAAVRSGSSLRVIGSGGIDTGIGVALQIDFLSLVSPLSVNSQLLAKVCPPLTSGPIALQLLDARVLRLVDS